MQIYTDGSAIGRTPNYYGGWGIVVVENDKPVFIKSGSKFPSTNNEMELVAIMEAILYIKPYYKSFGHEYIIYTDSNYALQSVTNWVNNWVKNDWKNSKKEPVANKSLIEMIYVKLHEMPNIQILKIKGHSGDMWNEMADDLATDASAQEKYKRERSNKCQ